MRGVAAQQPGTGAGGMPTIRSPAPVVLLVAGMLAAYDTPTPEAFVTSTGKQVATAVPTGINEVGEPCRYYQLASSIIGGQRDAVIYCGNWEQPSGRVSELAEMASPGQLNEVIGSGSWRACVDQRFACGAPVQMRILTGSPAALMQCSRRVDGWPHLALTSEVDGRLFAADAVRPALPAVEATIATLSGRAAPQNAVSETSEARRLIAQRTAGGSFGSGDTGRYFTSSRSGWATPITTSTIRSMPNAPIARRSPSSRWLSGRMIPGWR